MKNRFQLPPLFESMLTYEGDKKRSTAILYSIAVAIGLGLSVLMIERVEFSNFIPDPLFAFVFLIVIGSIFLIRCGYHTTAGSLLLVTLSLFLQYQCYRYDGLHDTALIAIPGLFAVAALMMGRILYYSFAGSSIASIIILAHLEMTGSIRNGFSSRTTIHDIWDVAVILSVTALTIKLLTDYLIKHLEASRLLELERRLQAERLLDSENRYRTLYEGGNDGAFLLMEDTVVECNSMGLSLMAARDKNDVIGHTAWEFCPQVQPDGRNSQEQGRAILQQTRDGIPQRIYWKFVRLDGRPFDAEVSITRLVFGGERYIQAFVRDITEQCLAMEENILLAQTIKSVKDCISITDLNNQIVFVNDAFMLQYGYSEEELMGKNISMLRPPEMTDETVGSIYPDTLRDGWHGELINRRKDGTDFPIELWTSSVKDSQGIVRATVGVARDITERKRVERQLIQAQKLDSIGALSGGIAHDFNNLLAMVLGSAELLRMQLSEQPGLDKNVNRIISAAERGRSISRRLLNFSRPDPADLVPVSPSLLVNELRDMLLCFFPKSITVEIICENCAGMILGDPGQIHQALLNLSLNAADAMDHNGCLTLSVRYADAESVAKRFGTGSQAPFLIISVADQGAGMDEATLGKIFDPFYSTKGQGKGTGLGLAIVHGIVKNHNGFISVDSAVGVGTTFNLYFPVIPEPAPVEEIKPSFAVRSNHETILLVEDEQHLRDLITDFLKACGYRVLTACDGIEALEIYRSHRESIDLVITDLGMPVMDGETLYHELRSIDADLDVIMASGFLDNATKNHLLESGIRDVLTKPFNLIDLQTALQTIFMPHEQR